MLQTVQIIGVPIDLGQSNRGVDLGPGAIRYAGLAARMEELGRKVLDLGNLAVPVRDAVCEEQGSCYLPSIRKVCEDAYLAGRRAVEMGYLPVFLGGDHSLSIGTIGGITHYEPAGVIWVDAHGDFNTPETSASGNIHGMPLAVLLGEGAAELVEIGRPEAKLKPTDVVMIGVRDLDPPERQRLAASGIKVYTMRDIDERGMSVVAGEALEALKHRKRLHVSLDVDALDPQSFPGAGTLVPGGLTYREAHLLMETIADTERLCSLDIVEINPILDDRNRTAQMAVELAISLFGKRIL
jgi:arginase